VYQRQRLSRALGALAQTRNRRSCWRIGPRGFILRPSARPKRPGAPCERGASFSASLNESTLQVSPGAPLGLSAGPEDGRARMRLLQSLAGRATAAFRSVLDDLATAIFPSDCRVCSGPLLRFTILPSARICRTSVPPQTLAMCRICGEALDIDMESARFASQFSGRACSGDDCRTDPPKFERAVCVRGLRKETARDDSPAQYERMSGVAKLLGPMLAEAILSIESVAARTSSSVPVPLFPQQVAPAGLQPVRAALPRPLWPKCNGRVQIGGLVWSPQSCAAAATREASLHSTQPAATGTSRAPLRWIGTPFDPDARCF